jgi:FkbM family methyltransferase
MEKLKTINRIIKALGIEISKLEQSDKIRRLKLIKHFKINTIFDVGANVGKYALEMRELGFTGKIVSFEPLSNAFEKLRIVSQKDRNWEAINVALGNKNELNTINIAGNLDSSSLLDMLPSHLKSAPETKYIGKETIKVVTLDSIFNEYYKEDSKIYMKIDTQGFEKNVLEGAKNSLGKIIGLQLEMSIIPLYENSPTYLDIIDYLYGLGYKLFSLENGFSDPKTGQLLQVDGIFF